ncbi:MAG: HD domain-containing protein [bacterium]|nr:HD domain-containing protein [bacterium]
MEHLTNLFKLMELTRSQPQYGYALAGIQQDELSNLAEHHYLVTFIAWQLASQVKKAGAKIDIRKVLEFGLIHDLGELFGGDISMPYARANPKAREYAKAFEEENQKFLSKFFGNQSEYFKELGHEILDAKSDESLIAKIADYIEATHYKQYVKVFSKFDTDLIKPKLASMVEKMTDPIAKKELGKFINDWTSDITKKEIPEILYENTEK